MSGLRASPLPRFAPCFALWLALLCASVSAALASDVRVFAAASLKTALDKVIAAYDGGAVTVSYAGSSALARQVQHGAPADLFLSANRAWVDLLEQRGLVTARVDLLSNRLVLIGAAQAATLDAPAPITGDFPLAERLGKGRLAMALVQAVPAGIYGKQALDTLGLWPSVAGRVAQTDNVRAALRLVSSGAAPLGIVYATDARADPRVRVLGAFPADSHDPITYPAARLTDTPEAQAFWEHLTSDAALSLFQRHGFLPPGA